MILIFTFSINQETGESTFAGNIDSQVALGLLQQIVILDAIRRSKNGDTGGATKEVGEAVESNKAVKGDS